MADKDIKPRSAIILKNLALYGNSYFSFNPAIFHKLFRRYSSVLLISTMILYGCTPVNTSNNSGTTFTLPKINNPAVKGLMDFLSGLSEREDLLSRHTLDDYVLALEAVLNEAGWGKAINHDDYEKVIGDVQEHLDDPNKPFLGPATPGVNPYPEGSWEHESFDKQHTTTCARDFPELAQSNPEVCK